MTLAAECVLWVSLSILGWVWVGYPILIWVWSRFRSDPAARGEPGEGGSLPLGHELPRLSLILAAYKEEACILARLQNAIAHDYPGDRFEVLVGCDGNEDLTGELVEAFADPRVRCVPFPVRRGKASVLNDCVPQATGEILVFSDANTFFDPTALRCLARHFADPQVGGVVGRLELTDPHTGTNADGLYWKFENFLKACEGRLGALLGANGAIYAIRRELFTPIPANTILDDFLIGMRVHLAGRTLIYDAAAVAREETPADLSAEFRRRARIGAGGFQSLAPLRSLLHPRHGTLAIAFWSHKVLRWLGPLWLSLALVSNACLFTHPRYVWLLLAQELFYLAAISVRVLRLDRRGPKLLRLPGMFVQMNAALAVGFCRWAGGIRSGTWVRTDRPLVGSAST